MTNFEAGYRKFANFIKNYELIGENDEEIVVAYSGGKDASLMCEFLYEYKKRNNLSLSIKLLVAKFPVFLFETQDHARIDKIKDAFRYWEKRGFYVEMLEYKMKSEEKFLDAQNPCKTCAKIKTELLGSYIRNEKNKIFALGMNFDDCISWFLEILLLSSKYKSINELKENEPTLFTNILTLTVRIVHKLYDKKNNIRFIRPIISFSNEEVKALVTEKAIPLIPEDCKEISERDTFSDSPRREFSEAIAAMRKKNNMNCKDNKATYNSYETMEKIIKESCLLPSIEELNDYMENSLMV